MPNFLPFTLGILAGSLAVRLARSRRAKQGLQRAGSTLRGATVSGLNSLEQTSAKVRARLEQPGASPAVGTEDGDEA